MADHYTKTAFALEITVADADFLTEITDLHLSTIPGKEMRKQFENTSARFKNAFPGSDEDPFEAYRTLFSDPDHPHPEFDVSRCGSVDKKIERVLISGDQIDPETLANIIQVACPSALPTGFCYNYGCDRLRIDEFGGGFVVVTDDEIIFRGTQEGLSSALAQIDNEDARALVLTKRDPDHGLSFWNRDTGFGRLAEATVFTPREAELAPTVIADDEPEWMTMPRCPQ